MERWVQQNFHLFHILVRYELAESLDFCATYCSFDYQWQKSSPVQ